MIPNLCKLKDWNSDPPSIYELLKSYVNYAKDEPVKVTDLAKAGRSAFFDFEYPLTNLISKEDFECMILNHFIMRRIGYETVTAFKIALNVRLNEIMPTYNKLFEALDGWSLFDGESTHRTLTRNDTNNAESNGTINDVSDRRFSNTPQNKITQIQDGSYVSEYNYDQANNTTHSTTNTSGNASENETVTHTLADKIGVYETFLKNKTHIYSMIFEDLEQLFYQVA